MWVAKNKDNSISFTSMKPVRGCIYGTCPTDNNGNLINSYWVCSDGSTPDYISQSNLFFASMFEYLKWEDEPVEVDIMPSDFLKKLLLDIKSNIRSGKYDGELWKLFKDLVEICGYQEINSTLTKTIH